MVTIGNRPVRYASGVLVGTGGYGQASLVGSVVYEGNPVGGVGLKYGAPVCRGSGEGMQP